MTEDLIAMLGAKGKTYAWRGVVKRRGALSRIGETAPPDPEADCLLTRRPFEVVAYLPARRLFDAAQTQVYNSRPSPVVQVDGTILYLPGIDGHHLPKSALADSLRQVWQLFPRQPIAIDYSRLTSDVLLPLRNEGHGIVGIWIDRSIQQSGAYSDERRTRALEAHRRVGANAHAAPGAKQFRDLGFLVEPIRGERQYTVDDLETVLVRLGYLRPRVVT